MRNYHKFVMSPLSVLQQWEWVRIAGRMEHLDEIGLKAYHRLQPSGKKPKASRDLSSSSTRTVSEGP